MTKIEFSRFKHEINLTQYAANLGYEIDKKKSTRHSIVMRMGNEDKVIISRQSGNWVYFSVYDDQDNGTIIDFVKNRTSKSLFEIGQELQVWIDGNITLLEPTRYVSEVQEKQPDPCRIQRLFNYCSPAYDHEYLKKQRHYRRIPKVSAIFGKVISGSFQQCRVSAFQEQTSLCLRT